MQPNLDISSDLNLANYDGKWVTIPVGPFIASSDVLSKFGSEDNYPDVEEFPFYGEGDCPLLPQALLPSMGKVQFYIQGPVLYKGSEADRLPPAMGERYVEIQRGTAIFTPNAEGRYSNKKHDNHVAIFLRYGNYGKDEGIFVIDQYKGSHPKKPGIRFIKKRSGAVDDPSNDGRAFAVVFALRTIKIDVDIKKLFNLKWKIKIF